MFKILVGIGQIIPIHQKLFLPPYLKQYESAQTYKYHGFTSRHKIENHHAFKD
jgi:hypothetical protein